MPEPHPQASELGDYLDGTLRARRTAEVERHLDACARCAAELSALRVVTTMLARLDEVEPRPGWLPGAARRVASGDPPGRTSWTRARLRMRVANGLVVVGAGAVGLGLCLAPPPPTPVSFQDEVRQHLVQIDNPLADQTSYVVEARYP